MNELHKALGEISSIRRQVARTTEFRGYGPATLATTSVFAVIAAGVQARWAPDAGHHLAAFLTIWIVTAGVSAGLIAVQMHARTRRMHSGLADEMIRMAAEQFLPAVGAGALLTLVVVRQAPGVVWMLPGLWQVIFSLGIFSSCRFLPRPMMAAGVWYLLTGLVTIAQGEGRAFSPWAMGIAFGVGQMMVAGILLWSAREAEREEG
jgi:hypothetical protein